MGIALVGKTNNFFFFFSPSVEYKKRIIERDTRGLRKYGEIRLLTAEIDVAEILRMCCLGSWKKDGQERG